MPKVTGPEHIKFIDEVISELELEKGLEPAKLTIIAYIETPEALRLVDEITNASPRVVAMILGSEDFCAATGMQPCEETLYHPNQSLVFAARQAGIMPLGFPDSIANFTDLDAFKQTIETAKRMGFRGGFAIHPAQVDIMNQVFAPSDEEYEHASGVLTAFEQALAKGQGTTSYKGKMIDEPVLKQAREVVNLYQSFADS